MEETIYDEQQLDSKIQQAVNIPSNVCLQLHVHQGRSAQTPLVVTYPHPLLSLRSIARCCHSILHVFEQLQGALYCHLRLPSLATSIRGISLSERVEFTSILYSVPGQCCCRAARYRTCPILITRDEFMSHTTDVKLKMKVNTWCKPSNVIYFI